MKEVLVNFFMSLRAAFIEEVSKEILATILPHLPHNETGLILLRGRIDLCLIACQNFYYNNNYYY